MKIGILTQPISWNYGGILQCWALQRVLRDMGHEPVKLERGWRNPWNLVLWQPFAIAKTAVWHIFGRRRDLPLNRLFGEIIQKGGKLPIRRLGISVSRSVYGGKALAKVAREMDAFIVGSDQVWRESYSSEIKEFFLDFLDASDARLRIAYAASFGKPFGAISEEKLPRCRELLHLFDAVSVREREAIEILRRDFGITSASLVLDPTLLLTADDYRQLIGSHSSYPHVTAYIIDNTPDKEKVVDEIAADLCTPIDRLCVRFEANAKGRSPRIEEWLHSIATADFVVTDSFHGTIFSIIFSKPFIVIGNMQRGLDRFYTLLEPIGLESRLIMDYTQWCHLKTSSPYHDIDFRQVHSLLDKLRNQSMDFLRNALSCNERHQP